MNAIACSVTAICMHDACAYACMQLLSVGVRIVG